ncbi:MAG: MotA/TolQ/ExbB proton channel family protein [Planctomycetota bacterium]
MMPVIGATSMWSLVSNAISSSSPLEQSVLYLLIFFSIVSWALILKKWRMLAVAKRNSLQFLSVFESASNIKTLGTAASATGSSPLYGVYKAGLEAWESVSKEASASPEYLAEKVQISMQHSSRVTFAQLRSGLGFLASISSASPFIGLFGTVWGIMATFQNLGDAKSASLAVVAPGISAALIATAAGLAVAIPAVMAYNWLLGRVDELQEKADSFIERMGFLLKHGGNVGAQSAPASDVLQNHHIPVTIPVITTAIEQLAPAGAEKA